MQRLSILVLAAALAACLPEPKNPAPPAAPATGATTGAVMTPAAATAAAKEIFANRCTPCHGPTGAGDGPGSAGLTPKPRNFTDATWQGTVTDEHIKKIVSYGGLAVGKSPAMPGNPDLADNDAVLTALAAHIRSLKK